MRLGLGILGLRQTRVRARARLRVLRWHGRPSLLNKYSLGHCGLSAASRHKLAFTSRHHALLTATDTTALY